MEIGEHFAFEKFLQVPSPLGGMEITQPITYEDLITEGSEPTGWDGDNFTASTEMSLKCFTFRAHWVGWRRVLL